MIPPPRLSRRLVPALLALLGAAGCGSPGGPVPQAPVITVSGVEDGATVTAPVTITIGIDVGTYQATLNGMAFLSGQTVRDPGDYTLAVTARNGDATSSLIIRFAIALAGDTRLIIRLFDLGANDAGGGGDAILLTDSSSAGQRHVLVDAGPAGVGGSDPGFVARRLAALAVDTLEALLLSHAHGDHFDGMPAVLGQVVVRRFIYNGQVRNFSAYASVLALAGSRADTVIVPGAALPLTVGLGGSAAVLTVLPPLTSYLADGNADASQINEGSLGAELAKGPFRMFLTGDGEVQANARWRTSFATRSGAVDVLKVGHHGANDAVFDNGFNGASTWLQHTMPAIAVISANGTSHPRVNALGRLLGEPATATYCTSVHGDIEIRVSETGAYAVRVERNMEADCMPGADAGT